MKILRERFDPFTGLIIFHIVLFAVEGIIVLITLLVEPSQSGGFLGFSLGRWALLGINLIALMGISYVLFRVWNQRAEKLISWFSSERHLFWIFFLSLFTFGIAFPAALGEVSAIRGFAYFGRLQPSLFWLALASGQILFTLLIVLRHSILRWFRQFFPLDSPAHQLAPLSGIQQGVILILLFAYFAFQWGSHLQVQQAEWVPDSVDYIFPATTYEWNEVGLWTHTKPWGAAVLYKLTGSSPVAIDALQTIISALAWVGLAWVVSRILQTGWLRVTAFAIVLGFSLAPLIQMWNHIIQSESLSISLMVIILATWLSLIQRWRWEKLVLLIVFFAWWIGARDTNIYLALMIAGFLFLAGLFFKRQRFYWGISILLVLFCHINLQIAEEPTYPRWLYPLTNTLLHRIVPEEEFLAYFEASGLPLSPDLLALSGGFANSDDFAVFNSPTLNAVEDWLYKRGKDVYIQFLVEHPGYTFTSPWRNVDEILGNQVLLTYTSERYDPLAAWVFGELFFLNPFWWLVLFSLAVFAGISIEGLWRSSGAFWLIFGFFVLFFPHMYLVWHGDAAEVGRHAIQASVQLRLSLWLLLFLTLDKIVSGKNGIRTRNRS